MLKCHNKRYCRIDYKTVHRGSCNASFDVTVVVADPELDRCRITADFTDHSLGVTLEMIS
jgi:hypothetical protein